MNTTTTLFLRSDPTMYTSPGRTYARVGVRDPARMYTYVAVFSFLHPARLYYDTCAPLHRPVYMYVHVRDQNDNATYASTRWVLTVREDKEALPWVRRCRWWVPSVRGKCFFAKYDGPSGGSQQSGGERFFAKYGGPSDGSLLSGGGIIILRVIRWHFLAAAVDPAVSLSTYSTLPMEVGR